jgi:hypothetical protein
MKEGQVALQYVLSKDPSTCERTIQAFQPQHKFNTSEMLEKSIFNLGKSQG